MSGVGRIGAIGLFALGIVQLVAGFAGIADGLGTFWAIMALVAGIAFRFTLPLIIGSFFGAMNVWGWNWFASILLALPGLAFLIPGIFTNIISGLKGTKKQQTSATPSTHNESKTNPTRQGVETITNFAKRALKATALIAASMFLFITALTIYEANKNQHNGNLPNSLASDENQNVRDRNKSDLELATAALQAARDESAAIFRAQREQEDWNVLGGTTGWQELRQANKDFAEGRTGFVWGVKRLILFVKTQFDIQLSGNKYENDPNFRPLEHIDELRKGIPEGKWDYLYSAKSLAHAKELRRLLLKQQEYAIK